METEVIAGRIVSGYARLSVATIGENLRRIRGDRPQRPIAEIMGVPQSQLSNWESDRHQTLTLKTLVRLAVAYNCTVEEIITDVDAQYGDRRDLVRQSGALQSGSTQDVGATANDTTATGLEQELREQIARYEAEAREVRTVSDSLAKVTLRLEEIRKAEKGSAPRRRRDRKMA